MRTLRVEYRKQFDAWYVVDADDGAAWGPYLTREAAQKAIDEHLIS